MCQEIIIANKFELFLLLKFMTSPFAGLDWSDNDVVLTQVLAASQQEYFDSLKKQKQQADSEASGSSGKDSSSQEKKKDE